MIKRDFPRPTIVVSRCLGFAACRWNGATINDNFVDRLAARVDYRPFCPEMEAGMGVPRDPARLICSDCRQPDRDQPRLIQPARGQDWTDRLLAAGSGFLAAQGRIDGFLLKSRSPSCGPREVRIYDGQQPGAHSRQGRGLFAAQAGAAHPAAPLEHEGRVRNLRLREHFLTKIFTLAAFDQVRRSGRMKDLIGFQADNKLLLMAYNQNRMRIMGRLIAGTGRADWDQTLAAYGEELNLALARAPRQPANINALMHGLGYFKKQLTSGEKGHFLDMIDLYRQGRIALGALQALLCSWALHYDETYLLSQTYFQPYPVDLLDLSDSGQGRTVD